MNIVMIRMWFRYFLVFFTLFTFLAVSLDTFRNVNSFQTHFLVSSRSLLITFLLLIATVRFTKWFYEPRFILLINQWIILPITTVLTVILSLFEYNHFPEYVFTQYELNYQQIAYLALGSLIFLLISKTKNWWRNHWKKAVGFTMPVLFTIFVVYHLWSLTNFKEIVKEDHLVEWLQFWFLVLSIILIFINANILKRKKNLFVAIIYILVGMFLVFMAGEEISWGQRILEFQTPDSIAVENLQKETTIHNLYIFQNTNWLFYLVITLYGSLSCLILAFVPQRVKQTLQLLIVPYFVSPFFIFALIYYLIASPFTPTYFAEWSEVAELMLYLGFFFFFFAVYLYLTKSQSLD